MLPSLNTISRSLAPSRVYRTVYFVKYHLLNVWWYPGASREAPGSFLLFLSFFSVLLYFGIIPYYTFCCKFYSMIFLSFVVKYGIIHITNSLEKNRYFEVIRWQRLKNWILLWFCISHSLSRRIARRLALHIWKSFSSLTDIWNMQFHPIRRSSSPSS